MKLYTEEQVKDMLNRVMMLEHHVVEFLNKYYTPIELPSDTAEDTADYIDRHIVKAMVEVAKKPINFPSDEEIRKESHNYFIRGQLGFEAAADTERAFLKGVLWMRDKIQGGNE